MPILKIGDKDPPYTYTDWLEWPLMEEGKMELIDGLMVTMATPTVFHAGIESELLGLIWTYLRGKSGKVFSSELGVHLEGNITVEPDLSVVLDTSKLTMSGYQGAPDFVVEILSPSNRKQDKIAKFNSYQKAGVKEYWIIDPDDRTIQANRLENGRYVTAMYGEEKVPVATLPGLEIDFAEVFAYAAQGISA
jgi:Uma2 family endonuclease